MPTNVQQPYNGGGPYTTGTFKLYLDGDATQATTGAKPWDALDVLEDGTCEIREAGRTLNPQNPGGASGS